MGFRTSSKDSYDESTMEYTLGLIVDDLTSIWATNSDEQIAANELYQKAIELIEQLRYWQDKSK